MLLYNINKMKQNFQDGVDSIYNAIVSAGTTPISNSLSDVVTGIGNMSTNRYNTGYNDGVVAGGNVGYNDGYNAGKTDGYNAGKTDGYNEGKTKYNPTNASLDNSGYLTVTNSSGVIRLAQNFSNSYDRGHDIGWSAARRKYEPENVKVSGSSCVIYNVYGEVIYSK